MLPDFLIKAISACLEVLWDVLTVGNQGYRMEWLSRVEHFFYRTGCIIVPVVSLGVFRIEPYVQKGHTDWRTLPVTAGEVFGGMFWSACIYFLCALFV